jgi:hypothetical protein
MHQKSDTRKTNMVNSINFRFLQCAKLNLPTAVPVVFIVTPQSNWKMTLHFWTAVAPANINMQL